jgi:hypothetical protein
MLNKIILVFAFILLTVTSGFAGFKKIDNGNATVNLTCRPALLNPTSGTLDLGTLVAGETRTSFTNDKSQFTLYGNGLVTYNIHISQQDAQVTLGEGQHVNLTGVWNVVDRTRDLSTSPDFTTDFTVQPLTDGCDGKAYIYFRVTSVSADIHCPAVDLVTFNFAIEIV